KSIAIESFDLQSSIEVSSNPMACGLDKTSFESVKAVGAHDATVLNRTEDFEEVGSSVSSALSTPEKATSCSHINDRLASTSVDFRQTAVNYSSSLSVSHSNGI